jgi:hypothetical protein
MDTVRGAWPGRQAGRQAGSPTHTRSRIWKRQQQHGTGQGRLLRSSSCACHPPSTNPADWRTEQKLSVRLLLLPPAHTHAQSAPIDQSCINKLPAALTRRYDVYIHTGKKTLEATVTVTD